MVYASVVSCEKQVGSSVRATVVLNVLRASVVGNARLLDTQQPPRYAPRMPALVATLTPKGLSESSFSGERISEIARQEPEGVYDVTRTYAGGRALLLDAYFERLERSACLEGIEVTIERSTTRSVIRQLLEKSGFEEARLRLTIPRDKAQNLIIAVADYAPFREGLQQVKAHGAKVATLAVARRNPVAKTNDWVHERNVAKSSLPEDVYEGIIVDEHGNLLEGFSSNFYVIRQGVLHTADDGILPGISRRILLAITPDDLTTVFQAPLIDQIHDLDEALLTSSGRGVVPIVQVDGHLVGEGKPGPITRQLMQSYDGWVERHLEEI